MVKRIGFGILIGGVVAALAVVAHAGDATLFDSQSWQAVLSRFVDDRGLVDYEALAHDRVELDRYLEQIAEIGPRSTPERFPTPSHELAYYLNAYNALVFDGVLDVDPRAETVWRGAVPGYGFFVGRKYRLDGQSINLRKLENKIIRPRFGDARVHAALNCASLGCPRLPTTAFDPARLDDQLSAGMVEFVSSERNVRLDKTTQTVFLSKIFDWYRQDFLDAEREVGNVEPSVIDYINRFRARSSPIPRDFTIQFMKYDKTLNRLPDSEEN